VALEGTLIDAQNIVRDCLDPFGNRSAVHRLGLERPKNEEIERAVDKIEVGVFTHIHGFLKEIRLIGITRLS